MSVKTQIKDYIACLPDAKRSDIEELHRAVLAIAPDCKLWFLDGTNADGKVVTNPNIGYGSQMMKYADGTTREFYRVGLTANSTGISVYIMGIEDKKYLADTYGKDLGQAAVTGYCIRFKKLADIDIDTLAAAIRYGLERPD